MSVGERVHSCPALSSPGKGLALRVGFGCLVGGDCEIEIGYWLGFAAVGLELGLEPGPGPGLGLGWKPNLFGGMGPGGGVLL